MMQRAPHPLPGGNSASGRRRVSICEVRLFDIQDFQVVLTAVNRSVDFDLSLGLDLSLRLGFKSVGKHC